MPSIRSLSHRHLGRNKLSTVEEKISLQKGLLQAIVVMFSMFQRPPFWIGIVKTQNHFDSPPASLEARRTQRKALNRVLATPTRSVGVCPEQNLHCSGHYMYDFSVMHFSVTSVPLW